MSHFVLVHGALCGGWVWDRVAAQLRDARHRVTVVDQLPSGDPSVLGDLPDDAGIVRQVLDGLAERAVVVGPLVRRHGDHRGGRTSDHPAQRVSRRVPAAAR